MLLGPSIRQGFQEQGDVVIGIEARVTTCAGTEQYHALDLGAIHFIKNGPVTLQNRIVWRLHRHGGPRNCAFLARIPARRDQRRCVPPRCGACGLMAKPPTRAGLILAHPTGIAGASRPPTRTGSIRRASPVASSVSTN